MLLEEQAPIESYTEWLEAMVERCVVQVRGQPCDKFYSDRCQDNKAQRTPIMTHFSELILRLYLNDL